MQLDPTDRDLAKKRAREAAELDTDPVLVDLYIADNPTLDEYGFPMDTLEAAFDELFRGRK